MELAPSLKTRLLTLQDSLSELVSSPVSPDNFHITLSYLGNTTGRQLETILDNFTALKLAPFEVSITELIYWPKPAIIALSLQDEQNKLLLCKKQIEHQLSQLNFYCYDKKQFLPHITLFRNVETPLNRNHLFKAKIQVNQISLIHSQSSRHGIHYQTIEHWSLQNPSVKQQLLGR